MKPNLTEALCTECGLCCGGSLFADVELAGADEASTLEVMGLEIEEDDDGAVLLQPCRALRGTRCSIYPHRPDCCRTFECRLLQEVRRGAVDVEQAKRRIAEALNQIEQVRELVGQLGPANAYLPLKECCAEALAFSAERKPDSFTNRKRAELAKALASVERLIQKTFLGSAG